MTPLEIILVLVVWLSMRLTYWRRRALTRDRFWVGENGVERIALLRNPKVSDDITIGQPTS